MDERDPSESERNTLMGLGELGTLVEKGDPEASTRRLKPRERNTVWINDAL